MARAARRDGAKSASKLSSSGPQGQGGAYGLGKAVLWRASRLSTVLFHSILSVPAEGRGRSRLIGRCDLSWHEYGAVSYAGPGWFGRT